MCVDAQKTRVKRGEGKNDHIFRIWKITAKPKNGNDNFTAKSIENPGKYADSPRKVSSNFPSRKSALKPYGFASWQSISRPLIVQVLA
jgi:hypothetical protein